MMDFVVPILIFAAVGTCLFGKVDVYSEFCGGVEKGFKTLIGILPAMVAVMSAASMLRASGVMGVFAQQAARILPFDIPEELITLAVLRPVSGGGSVALLAEILNRYGPDSVAGRIASVIAASSETTLYVLMVYFGVTKVKQTKKVLFAALVGDAVCVAVSIWACGVFK